MDFELLETPTATRVPPGMVLVPAGRFRFGAEGAWRELPAFAIDRTPITNAAWIEIAGRHGLPLPPALRNEEFARAKGDHPVVGLSWERVRRVLLREGFDLPSEEEWEKAARGTDGRSYPWGDAFDSARCNTRSSGRFDSTPVASHAEGASPWGVLDLAGNVWEWTSSTTADGLVRVKGGSWFDPPALARADRGLTARPDFASSSIGFRRVWRGGAAEIATVSEDRRDATPSPLDALSAEPFDFQSFAELAESMRTAVERTRSHADAWETSFDHEAIDGALRVVLADAGAPAASEEARESLRRGIEFGDLAAARKALLVLERLGASAAERAVAAQAIAAAEVLQAAAPSRTDHGDPTARRWWILVAVLALANGALWVARISGQLG